MPNKFVERLQLKYCDKKVCGYEVKNCPILEIIEKVNAKKTDDKDKIKWCPWCNGEVFGTIKYKMGKVTVTKPDGQGGFIEDISRDGRTRGMSMLYACPQCQMGGLRRDGGFKVYLLADEEPHCFRQRHAKILHFKTEWCKERQALFSRAKDMVKEAHEQY